MVEELNNLPNYVNQDCPYQKMCERFLKKKDCYMSQIPCKKRFRIDRLNRNAMWDVSLAKRFDCFVDNANRTDKEAFQLLRQYSNDIEKHVQDGDSLYIYSTNVGNGKTSWAYDIGVHYITKTWRVDVDDAPVLFVHVPTFLTKLKDSISKPNPDIEYMKEWIEKSDLVIWDEVGSKCGTEFERNILLAYIDGRISHRKSNIYTSNEDFPSLQALMGDRLASRVYNESVKVMFTGTDKRGKKVVGVNHQ